MCQTCALMATWGRGRFHLPLGMMDKVWGMIQGRMTDGGAAPVAWNASRALLPLVKPAVFPLRAPGPHGTCPTASCKDQEWV